MPKPVPVAVDPFVDPDADEQRTVHDVYDAIAPHFARTRFKPWPLIDTFLRSQPPGSIGLDSGAGNGKYVPVAFSSGSSMIALDRSGGLLEIAHKAVEEGGAGAECVRADLTERCWRPGVFDFAISIAAVHHLSTPERRQRAIQTLLHPLRISDTPPFARFMIYVWAYEQGPESRRKMGTAATSTSAPNSSTTDPSPASAPESTATKVNGSEAISAPPTKVQDVLVPWVLAPKPGAPAVPTSTAGNSAAPDPSGSVFHRYYHLFVEGELGDLVRSAAIAEGFEVVDSVPVGPRGEGKGQEGEERNGEGERWLRVIKTGWEADNWWIEGEVGKSQ